MEEKAAETFSKFLPQDHPEEKSRSVKICTKSTHAVIILMFLLMLLLYAIVKTIATSSLLEKYLMLIFQNKTLNNEINN